MIPIFPTSFQAELRQKVEVAASPRPSPPASLDVTPSIKELRSFNCPNYHHAGEFEDAYQSAQQHCREDRRLGYPAALAEYRPVSPHGDSSHITAISKLTLWFRLRNIIFFLFLWRWTKKGYLKLKGRGFAGSTVDGYVSIRRTLYGLFLRAPGVRTQVQKQVNEAITKLQSKLIQSGPGITRHLTLPKEGWSDETVQKELETLATMDHTRWEDGFVSGAVYHGGDDLIKLQTEAFGKFTVANPIHPDVFPGVRKMEAEIVAMVLGIFNAPPGAAGATTSGGTESILMACLSARQKAYVERGVTEPEM